MKVLLILVSLMTSAASSIVFTSSSSSIQPLLSKNLTLRCGLEESVIQHDTGFIGKRDIKFLISIMITRHQQDDIATINDYMPAKAMGDLGSIQVEGDVTGTSGDKGYLQVTWAHPTHAQVGDYQCLITAIRKSGHGVILKASMQVNATPSIQELVKFISEQQQEIIALKTDQQNTTNTNLKKEIISLQTKVINQQQTISQIQSNNTELKNKITSLEAKQTTLQQQNTLINTTVFQFKSDLSTEIENMKHESQHIETGWISCGGTTGWSYGDHGVKHITNQFIRPYPRPPVGFTSVRKWRSDSDKRVEFHAYVSNVNTTHITVRCYKIYDTSNIDHMYVDWITFPQ